VLVDPGDIGLSFDAHRWLIPMQSRGTIMHTVGRARSIPDCGSLARDLVDFRF